MSAPHPFLVDQRPYLARACSPAPSSVPSYSISRWSTSTTSLASSASSTSSHSRNHSTSSFDAPTVAEKPTESIGSATPADDSACFRFMRHASESAHLFGSVSSRGSSLSVEERRLRREAGEEAGRMEVEPQVKDRRRRFGRIF